MASGTERGGRRVRERLLPLWSTRDVTRLTEVVELVLGAAEFGEDLHQRGRETKGSVCHTS